jgi:hypothetical protein
VVELDVNGALVRVSDKDAALLRDAAAAQAGRSAAARDLSLLVERALSSRRSVALQRGELRALRSLLANDPHLAHLEAAFDPGGEET